MKKYQCEKCGTRHRPSRHHNLPKVFFNGRGEITWLCIYCHRVLENKIYQSEKDACGSNKIRRFNLGEDRYKEILKDFLAHHPIEFVYGLKGKEFLCGDSSQC